MGKQGTVAEPKYGDTWDVTAVMESCCLCFGFHPWQDLTFPSLRSKYVALKLQFEKYVR